MAGEVSFDVVSDFDEQELRNALDQVRREVPALRLQGRPRSRSSRPRTELVLMTDDEFRAGGGQGPDRVEGDPAQPVAQDLRLGQGRAGRRQQGPTADRAASRPARGGGQAHLEARPRRVPEVQGADPGRRGPGLGQEQGRPPAGDRPAARARRAGPAPVRELPLAPRRPTWPHLRPPTRHPSPDLEPVLDEPEPSPDAEPVGEEALLAEPAGAPEAVADVVDEAPEPSGPVDHGPPPGTERVARTVGRVIADALHAAGVTDRLHRPGRELPGPPRRARSAGIRVVAARHEGGAAFMAEAYGQLTGRPGVCLGDPCRRRRQPGHRHPHRPGRLHPDVRHRRRRARARIGAARPSRRSDLVGSIGRIGQVGGRRSTTRRASSRSWPRPSATPSPVGPGPVLITVPEDLLDERCPAIAPGESAPFRPTRVEPEPDDVRAVLQLLAGARRPVILAGAGVLRSRGTADLVRLAELLEIPVIASWRRADVFPNDHRLYLGMTGYGAPRVGARPARRGRRDRRPGLSAQRDRLVRIRHPDERHPLGPRRPRAAGRPCGPVGAGPGGDRRRPHVPARRPTARARRGVLRAEPFDARRAANEADRAAYEVAASVSTTSRGTGRASTRAG